MGWPHRNSGVGAPVEIDASPRATSRPTGDPTCRTRSVGSTTIRNNHKVHDTLLGLLGTRDDYGDATYRIASVAAPSRSKSVSEIVPSRYFFAHSPRLRGPNPTKESISAVSTQ